MLTLTAPESIANNVRRGESCTTKTSFPHHTCTSDRLHSLRRAAAYDSISKQKQRSAITNLFTKAGEVENAENFTIPGFCKLERGARMREKYNGKKEKK